MAVPKSLDFVARAQEWLGADLRSMDEVAKRVVQLASRRRSVAGDANRRLDQQATFGERLADRVATFGGSWAFIILFSVVLLAWTVLNTEVLGKTAFDPYPYIFLNLMLSMVAALQAPVIMMSQNRQSVKDRQMAAFDYEVNLKAELEVMALHEKVDSIRNDQLMVIVAQQQQQIELLTRLLETNRTAPPPSA